MYDLNAYSHAQYNLADQLEIRRYKFLCSILEARTKYFNELSRDFDTTSHDVCRTGNAYTTFVHAKGQF